MEVKQAFEVIFYLVKAFFSAHTVHPRVLEINDHHSLARLEQFGNWIKMTQHTTPVILKPQLSRPIRGHTRQWHQWVAPWPMKCNKIHTSCVRNIKILINIDTENFKLFLYLLSTVSILKPLCFLALSCFRQSHTLLQCQHRPASSFSSDYVQR